VDELRRRGHEVWGCDLAHDGDPQYVRADVALANQLAAAFVQARPEVVYHLAAEFGRHNGEDFTEQLWTTAMIGTRNVLEACQAFGAHLIFGSSSEIYGDYDADWLREDLPDEVPGGCFQPNEYALSKWTNERQIRAFRRRHPEMKTTILRFFNTYGPGEAYHPYRSVVALFCRKALDGHPLPVYEGYHRTFMYVDDFTPTLANVCEADLMWDTYNIGGLDYRNVQDLARIVQEVVHLRDGATVAIDLIPEDKHNARRKRPDISRAMTDLGHDPKVVLEDGVPRTLEWMRLMDRPVLSRMSGGEKLART
jgi:dTDP-glucose 4,6-dehydratase